MPHILSSRFAGSQIDLARIRAHRLNGPLDGRKPSVSRSDRLQRCHNYKG
jgi:hypothetical protein